MSVQRWTLRVCKKCGDHHGRQHDGCVTHSHPMYPQATEHAGVDEIEVMPVAEHERLMANRCTCLKTCGDTPEETGGVCKGLPR